MKVKMFFSVEAIVSSMDSMEVKNNFRASIIHFHENKKTFVEVKVSSMKRVKQFAWKFSMEVPSTVK